MNPAHNASLAELERAIRNVPDFPKPGIQFKDITPLLGNARLFAASVDWLIAGHTPGSVHAVAGIDARGFLFAGAAALRLGAGCVPIRKRGKLPYRTIEESYDLEYGANTIAIHADAVAKGSRVLLLDDLLATGGTARAAASLLRRLGADIVDIAFLVELVSLEGRAKLEGYPVRSLIRF